MSYKNIKRNNLYFATQSKIYQWILQRFYSVSLMQWLRSGVRQKESASGMQRRDAGIRAFAVFRSISQFATLVMHHVVDDIRNCIACAAELQSGDWIMQRCCASCASQTAKPSHGIKPVTMLTKQYTYRWGYRCVLPSREIAEAVAAATYACRCTMPRITHSTPINMIRPETLIAFYLSLRLEIA